MHKTKMAVLATVAAAVLVAMPLASGQAEVTSASYLNFGPDVELQHTPNTPSGSVGVGLYDQNDPNNFCLAGILGLRPTALTFGLNYDQSGRLSANIKSSTGPQTLGGVLDQDIDPLDLITLTCNQIDLAGALVASNWNSSLLGFFVTLEGLDADGNSNTELHTSPVDITLANQFSHDSTFGDGIGTWTALNYNAWAAFCADGGYVLTPSVLLPSGDSTPSGPFPVGVYLFGASIACSGYTGSANFTADLTVSDGAATTGFQLQNVQDYSGIGANGYLVACASTGSLEQDVSGVTITHTGVESHDWFYVLDVAGSTAAAQTGIPDHFLVVDTAGTAPDVFVYQGSYDFAGTNGDAGAGCQ